MKNYENEKNHYRAYTTNPIGKTNLLMGLKFLQTYTLILVCYNLVLVLNNVNFILVVLYPPIHDFNYPL